MAPVRRYLRISKYSVLECRIYLENPALVHSWLLNPRNPILPRVIESVRPWVLPKLREERERTRKKSSNRRKGIKDTVVEDDFEVSIFLTETNTRHSILAKNKHFHESAPQKIHSNTNKLTGETNENPVDVDATESVPVLREEESGEKDGRLADIPAAPVGGKRRSGRHGNRNDGDDDFESSDDETASAIEVDSDTEQPPPTRFAGSDSSDGGDDGEDDKKKLAMDVSYDGFAIYGRVLCLVVRKKDHRSLLAAGKAASGQPSGQASMENWITSTQIPVGEDIP